MSYKYCLTSKYLVNIRSNKLGLFYVYLQASIINICPKKAFGKRNT